MATSEYKIGSKWWYLYEMDTLIQIEIVLLLTRSEGVVVKYLDDIFYVNFPYSQLHKTQAEAKDRKIDSLEYHIQLERDGIRRRNADIRDTKKNIERIKKLKPLKGPIPQLWETKDE